MLSAMNSVSAWLLLLLAALAFAANAFAIVDAVRQRPDAFTAAGKLTKQLWLLITGVAAAIGFVYLYYQLVSGSQPAVFGFPNIIAFVASAVYLVDVRPALRRMTGNNRGPYGGW